MLVENALSNMQKDSKMQEKIHLKKTGTHAILSCNSYHANKKVNIQAALKILGFLQHLFFSDKRGLNTSVFYV